MADGASGIAAKATTTPGSGRNHDNYTDAYLKDVLDRVRVIAMVGASTDWNRPSSFVMKYLRQKGFRVIPINPKAAAAGQTIQGETVYAGLADVPEPIDMVDIFRSSEAAGPIVDAALALTPPPKVIWMQLTVRNDAAAARAEAAGLEVVMNRCPKIEYSRLHGELSWTGINSKLITSKRRKLSR